MFRNNDICILHHTVLTREGRDNIFVELKRQQHDKHTQQIGKEKAYELTDAEMTAKEFPNEFHSLKTFS